MVPLGMQRIVVLISGRGSNMQSLVLAARAQSWPATICAVISNQAQAAGLAWAGEQSIATEVVSHRAFAEREQFDRALAQAVERHRPDLVVLAGFMRVLGSAFVQQFAGRLINIHPSLLPAFKGLNTHARALAEGVKIHGATVHLVSPQLDGGVILAQAAVPVLADDNEQALAARVLAAEHKLYPMVVQWIVSGQMRLGIEQARFASAVSPPAQGLWSAAVPSAEH